MRVWTNGAIHLVLGPVGLQIHRGTRCRVVRLSEDAVEDSYVGADPCIRDVLAVSPAGSFAWASLRSGAFVAAPLAADEQVKAVDWRLANLVMLDNTRFVAARREGSALRLVRGEIGESLTGETALELPPPTQVAWPALLFGDAPPWSRAKKLGAAREPTLPALSASQSPFGVAFADLHSGVVCVARPDAAELLALRLPSQADAQLHAAATEQGALCVLSVEGRGAALAHFAADGRCLASRLFEGKCAPPGVIDRERGVFASVEGGSIKVRVIRLDSLEDETVLDSDPVTLADRDLGLHLAADGSALLVGTGKEVVVVKHGKRGWRIDVLPMPALRAAPPGPKVPAPPKLGLFGSLIARRFVGDPLKLRIAVSSMGGPGAGVAISVSGSALEKGILRASSVRIESDPPEEAPFSEEGRAELPDLKIVERKEAEAHRSAFAITLQGEAARVGEGVLEVSLAPLGVPEGVVTTQVRVEVK